ncbi:MAG: hypothetical protein RMJ88_15595 [Thermogemmata sp.]|nr:hypothetical protein [Thermogemmata sp.]
MMNTWFTEIIRNANESIFSESDLTRIMAYYASMPARLKLSEELEKLEPSLTRKLHNELSNRYPGRRLYSRRLVQDIVESLRHINRAILADDMRLLRYRWIDHLLEVGAALNLDMQEIRDAYVVLGEILQAKLPRSAWALLEPVLAEINDALTRGPALRV